MKNTNTFLIFFLSFYAVTVMRAQTINGTGGIVPTTGNYISFNLAVSGITPAAMNSSYGLTGVCFDITHPDLTELLVKLVSPSGQTVEIVKTNPSGGQNYTSTCFDGTAGVSINSGTAPYTGLYRPTGYIGAINKGTDPNGNWQLQVKNWNFFGSPGMLNSWSLTFGPNPLTPVAFSSSNLPIVVINTLGQTIEDEPKKTMNMSVIYNSSGARNYLSDPPNHYNGKVQVECRGSSSLQFEKKSIGIETVDNAGANLDVSLFGMPEEHDWILYASYVDKTLIRNALTFDLANRMGGYASRNKFVELVIDGQYQGVYALQEKIKRGKSRVDISKLAKTENSGDGLTGGYIIRIDKNDGSEGGWRSKIGPASGTTDTVFFQYYYPKDTTITNDQKTYIQGYINDFEQTVMSSDFANTSTGYIKYIDLNSFVDYFIICELTKNIDAYKISTYIYKDKASKGGKLKLGPVWDFDLAWNNANYGLASDPTGWEYTQTSTPYEIPRWWERFMQDPNFQNRIKCRWEQLRNNNIITPATLLAKVDSFASVLSESQARNFKQWPILDANVWANPLPIPNSYPAHISELKNWITSRYNWLNGSMPGVAQNCFVEVGSESLKEIETSVYPNPFKQTTTLSYYLTEPSDVTIKVYDILGKEVTIFIGENKQAGEHEIIFNGEELKTGIYFYRLIAGNKTASGKMIMEQ